MCPIVPILCIQGHCSKTMKYRWKEITVDKQETHEPHRSPEGHFLAITKSWENLWLFIQIGLIVWVLFLSHLGIFHSYRTSSLPVKGCKVWPMFGTRGHWAVRVLSRTTPTVTQGIRLYWSSPRSRDSHTCCRAFGSGAVSTCFNDLGHSRPGIEPRIRYKKQEAHRPLQSYMYYVYLKPLYSRILCARFGWSWFNGSAEKISKRCHCIFTMSLFSIEVFSPKDALCHIWLKLSQLFWRRRFLNFINTFSLFRNYLPLEKGEALHLNKLESPFTQGCQVD